METNADWSPFEGWELAGFARTTLSRGDVIVDDYRVVGERGVGSGFVGNRELGTGNRGTERCQQQAALSLGSRFPVPCSRERMTTQTGVESSTYTPPPTGKTDDIASSPLYNADLAPTPPERRTWSTYNIAALWIGMSVVITTYTLASGLMAQGMKWWQAMITILLGNTIVLVPMILNAHAGTKYGLSFPVLCRASFGVRGANVPAMLRAIVACGWFGIQTWIGALALDALFGAALSGWNGVPGKTAIAFAVFWGIQVVIILKAPKASRSSRAGRRRCC
jgi:hypothetical protein